MKYTPVIGLEVHIELATKSKMFCSCSAYHFGQPPNTNTCPTCLGLPGALPFANKKAIADTIKFGLAFGSKIAEFSKFDRKHYFYPDLPKAFQTSQYDLPFCWGGAYILPSSGKTISLTRVHLEEDTAKSVHKKVDGKVVTLVDFNRSSVPLMEMVTEPDFDNSDDMISFLKEIQKIVRYLEISDADMEKGSMRLEANVSVANEEEHLAKRLPDYKIELKNINSFKFLKRSVDIEIERHKELRDSGKIIPQETRGYDEIKDTTFSQRSKEDAQDYRYFPEPDLPPLRITGTYVEKIRSTLPELPNNKRVRYLKDFGLSTQYIEVLVSEKYLAEYFEKAVEVDKKYNVGVKTIASAIVNQKLHTKHEEPAGLIKQLVEMTKKNFAKTGDTKAAARKALEANPKAVTDYQDGNTNVVGFLMGQVQKELKGKGDPKFVRQMLIEILEK